MNILFTYRAQSVLDCLAAYIEWVSGTHVFGEDVKLASILCILLADVNFRQRAANCLLAVSYIN